MTRLSSLTDMASQVLDGVVSIGEAVNQVTRDADLLAGGDPVTMAATAWFRARTNRRTGSVVTALLAEWTAIHDASNAPGVFATAQSFVRAATEVLIARDDSDLYRRAQVAADRMVAIAADTMKPSVHFAVGLLHLAPYALDPVHEVRDYEFNRLHRTSRERWSRPTYSLANSLMPEPAVGLDLAVRHLATAAAGMVGEQRGEALAHLAFAEYSRHVAGGGADLSDVDRFAAESAALLSPVASPTLGDLPCPPGEFSSALTRTTLAPAHSCSHGSAIWSTNSAMTCSMTRSAGRSPGPVPVSWQISRPRSDYRPTRSSRC